MWDSPPAVREVYVRVLGLGIVGFRVWGLGFRGQRLQNFRASPVGLRTGLRNRWASIGPAFGVV